MALRATSQTIAEYLENQCKADALLSSNFNGGGLVGSMSTPLEMVEQLAAGRSVKKVDSPETELLILGKVLQVFHSARKTGMLRVLQTTDIRR